MVEGLLRGPPGLRQYRDDANHPYTKTFAAKAVGSVHTYEADWVQSEGLFHFLVDGSTIWTSVHLTWVPNEFEVHGETHNWDD